MLKLMNSPFKTIRQLENDVLSAVNLGMLDELGEVLLADSVLGLDVQQDDPKQGTGLLEDKIPNH